jgi:hypothetical protein
MRPAASIRPDAQARPFLVGLVSLACASGPPPEGPPPQVWARSLNSSQVEIYMQCGFKAAKWVGEVPAKGATAFDLSDEEASCLPGLNFFLVVRDQGRGYWVGPIRPARAAAVEVVIEKYAGLSTARSLGN